MAVSKRLRYEILRRDNHACRYCGATAPDTRLTVDHVIPVTLGGTDDPSNLVTACAACNSGKSATPPGAPLVNDVAADALRWAHAMRLAASFAEEQREMRQATVQEINLAWLRWHRTGYPDDHVPRPDDWAASIEQFLNAGLTDDEILDAIPIAMRANVGRHDRWRYFCGVCWRKLKALQDEARDLIDRGIC